MVVNGGKITEIVPLYKYLQSVRWAKKFLSVCHLDQQSRVYLLKSQRTFYRCVLRSLSVGILISVDYWWTTNVAVRGLDEVNSIQVNVKKMSGDCLVPQNNAVDIRLCTDNHVVPLSSPARAAHPTRLRCQPATREQQSALWKEPWGTVGYT